MSPGPQKSFDVEEAVLTARDLFWERGYDGTGIRDLEVAIGIGRKSLYDTFGSKRELYLRSLRKYADTVIQSICDGLEREGVGALANLERVLGKLQKHHGSDGSLGCLLGVAIGQIGADDEELAAFLRGVLDGMEQAFERCLREAMGAGEVRSDLQPRDAARQLVALSQGMALLGRVSDGPARSRSIIRAALAALRPVSSS
ncbi:HTH-type transcriptional repressor ComR [Planctomycetes bacterium Poly30]|uniref:HTH-type transcriptional repressor ComR n=1 Tax=Saltatorellus ferox TaxID=2528018 RepID=A0A518EMD2_9BACT|nr:HTH-type transcriptional repressor ComR [Planctomycetes bacterium Poly30]